LVNLQHFSTNAMSQKRILICPLNWGIGHASRLVPIIKELIDRGQEVIIAADKAPLAFLQLAFPALEFIVFPGFEPFYSRGNTQVFNTLASVVSIQKGAAADHRFVEKVVKTRHIDGIISDNRFGAYSKQVPSVFITHQMHISVPMLLSPFRIFVNGFNHYFIRRHNECWVPDYESALNLSGKLSHPPISGLPVHYIGPLSRFATLNDLQYKPTKYDVLALLSGPEPQRTLLEMKIIREINGLPIKMCIVRGKPGFEKKLKQTDKLHLFNHAKDELLIDLIQTSSFIISRPGYSTIMDLIALKKRAFFVPTPGQTEQEYLARRMHKNGWFNCGKQEHFDVMYALADSIGFEPPVYPDPSNLIKDRITSWIKSL
jgi:uncharacterized protein (TIGR00661 family)